MRPKARNVLAQCRECQKIVTHVTETPTKVECLVCPRCGKICPVVSIKNSLYVGASIALEAQIGGKVVRI